MKVLVINNAAPFIWGGAEELALNLTRALNQTPGIESELMRVPFSWAPTEQLLNEIILNRSFRLTNVDRVIALKFPAYLIPHPNKTLWLLHQFRQAYDLRDAGASSLGSDPASMDILNAIRRADSLCFSECRKVFTNSPVTQERLLRYNGFEAEVLYPPLNDASLFQGGEYGDYLFAGGRVARGKRQLLLVSAMRHVRAPVRLLIAGPPEEPELEREIRATIEHHELGDRVELICKRLERSEIAAFVNGSLACAYIPFDEDSLGYVTMEAFSAGKAVVTTSDSGGLLEIVREGETGAVAMPDPEAIGEAIDRVVGSTTRARALGCAARSVLDARQLTWTATVEKLLL